MTVNKGSLVSGRVAVTDYANLTADRYQFLGLTQAEPNLGPGANNTVLVITTNNTRSWSNSLTLTGNVSANYFIGNGSLLTGIFTTITNQTFQGDGSTVAFTLQQTATAVSILVTVNGITQTPDVDYLVITNILTFTTAPANADVIQVRFLSNNSVSGTYSNADVAAFLPTYTGNITAANLSATGNIQGQYILGNGAFLTGIAGGGNVNTGNVTFDNINVIGTGNLHLQPDPANSSAYLDIFLTGNAGPDIHIAGNGANVIIGRDSGANVLVGVDGRVSIQADAGTPYNWTFGYDATLTAPGNIQMSNTGGIYSSTAGYVVGLRMSNTEPSVKLVANDHEWQFNSNGVLKFPTPYSSTYPAITMAESANLLIQGYLAPGFGEDGGNVVVSGGFGDGNNGNATVFGQQVTVQTQLSAANGSPTYSWTFGSDGELTTPQGGRLGNAGKGWQGLDGGNGNPVSFTSFYANGNYAGCLSAYPDGTLNITTYGDGTGQLGQWTFSSANLLLASQNVSGDAGESALLAGTRKIVNGQYSGAAYKYSAELAAGGTPSVAYTASNEYVQSVRLTFAVESVGTNPQWEQFDVVATKSLDTPGSVNFVVSNRIKARASIADTVVTATINLANEIEISLNLDAGQTSGWSSFDAVEFGVMFN